MKTRTFAYLSAVIVLLSCNEQSTKETDEDSTTTDSVSDSSIALFDGQTLQGWHGYNKTGEITNWKVIDGSLVCMGAAPDAHGGDIVTDKNYANFELSWEWKVDTGSNSGVMYHVVEDTAYQAPYHTGPEYQVIDDATFPEKLETWQMTGADYAMTPANDKKQVKPVGEWNSSMIIFKNGHVEHWLNGEKIVEFEAWTDEWNKKVAEGKWKEYPGYGKAKTGKIALQDHGNKAYFRNIRIVEL